MRKGFDALRMLELPRKPAEICQEDDFVMAEADFASNLQVRLQALIRRSETRRDCP